ncbi:M48 family metallopeptidase [Deinococcus planocerae]|uniref:M48 family metallopeptidase n=1 Tax=Deinococcus planocerae TaxID=1737569 RepID=UPI000C7EE11A|nr:M48 family metallopeptidase [Deinococcus planocerae]
MTDPAPPTLTLSGVYFDGRTSRDRAATLEVSGGTLVLRAEGGLETRWEITQLGIDPPIPGIRRVLKFPGGARFETADDAGVSALEARLGRNRGLGRVRRLESRWGTALGAVALMVLFAWGFVAFGLPALARTAATATPDTVLATFDRETVELLEGQGYVGPSRLSAARQAQLQRVFRRVTARVGGDYPYRLLLRDGAPQDAPFELGANAFALPGGTVFMTDQLVRLARDDRELAGVLAHEAGHVTHRHGLAGVYQGLGLSLLTVAVTGDLISAGTFAAAVPAALLRSGYSRAAETESDEVAARFLLREYGTTKPLRDLLARLETQDRNADETDVEAGSRVEDLLQTHPGTAQRIRHLRELEERAKAR